MAAPLPSFFRNLIPGATSGLCEKFNKLAVGLSRGVVDWVAFEYSEDGQSLTDEFVELLCAAQCGGGTAPGGGTENPNMPTPTGVSASDGTYSSKVYVVWNEVTPPSGSVSNYLVYRSLSTNTDPTAATLIATVSGTTFSYDDTTVVAGTTYNYWVRATNGTENSAYAGPDSGYATTFEESLPAVADLQATKGVSPSGTGLIRLVFTAPSGTTSVDVYRNTTDDSGTATLVHTDVVCQDTTASQPTPATGVGVNNSGGTDLLIYHLPPNGSVEYFFWVKCKSAAPPRISPFSNSASGWVQIGVNDTGASDFSLITAAGGVTVPLGKNQMRIVMVGGGGAGAGASPFWGAGAGAGGDTLYALVDVTPLETFTYSQEFFVNPSASFGNPPSSTPLSGLYSYEGKSSILTRDSDAKQIIVLGGGSGLYSSSGSGSGGPAPGGNTGIESGINASEISIFKGKAGESATGSRGGRGGHAFGTYATPPAHFLAGSFNGDPIEGSGGGGSSIASSFAGGSNAAGYLLVCFLP